MALTRAMGASVSRKFSGRWYVWLGRRMNVGGLVLESLTVMMMETSVESGASPRSWATAVKRKSWSIDICGGRGSQGAGGGYLGAQEPRDVKTSQLND